MSKTKSLFLRLIGVCNQEPLLSVHADMPTCIHAEQLEEILKKNRSGVIKCRVP